MPWCDLNEVVRLSQGLLAWLPANPNLTFNFNFLQTYCQFTSTPVPSPCQPWLGKWKASSDCFPSDAEMVTLHVVSFFVWFWWKAASDAEMVTWSLPVLANVATLSISNRAECMLWKRQIQLLEYAIPPPLSVTKNPAHLELATLKRQKLFIPYMVRFRPAVCRQV